jgi:hypothetical protein
VSRCSLHFIHAKEQWRDQTALSVCLHSTSVTAKRNTGASFLTFPVLICCGSSQFLRVYFKQPWFQASAAMLMKSVVFLFSPRRTTYCELVPTPSLILLAVVTSHVSRPRYAVQFLCYRFSFLLESWPVKMGPIRCPETSVNNYHTTPCNYSEDHRFYFKQILAVKKQDVRVWTRLIWLRTGNSCVPLTW